MFSYILSAIFGNNKKVNLNVVLKGWVYRNRYVKQRNATIKIQRFYKNRIQQNAAKSIQSFYRYHRDNKLIKLRLNERGYDIQEIGFYLKQRHLLKLRSDLYCALNNVDNLLV